MYFTNSIDFCLIIKSYIVYFDGVFNKLRFENTKNIYIFDNI